MESQNGRLGGHRRIVLVIAIVCQTATWACDQGVQPSPLPGRGPAAPFNPAAPAGPSGPTGSYALTLTASPSCANGAQSMTGEKIPFPESVRVRRYDAEFADGAAILKATDGTGNQVKIGGTETYFDPGTPLMTMKDNVLTVVVPPGSGRGFSGSSFCDLEGFFWYEVSSTDTAFALCGTWRGSTTDSANIDGTITGTFEYYPNGKSALPVDCYATDHQFTLTRVGG